MGILKKQSHISGLVKDFRLKHTRHFAYQVPSPGFVCSLIYDNDNNKTRKYIRKVNKNRLNFWKFSELTRRLQTGQGIENTKKPQATYSVS